MENGLSFNCLNVAACEFPGLELALVPDLVVPEAEQGMRMKQKSRFKFLPWPGFESRTSQSNGRKRYHSIMVHHPKYL